MVETGRVAGRKISGLLSWERGKRRETILISALFYSLLASFLVLPIAELLSLELSPVSLPLLFFLVLTPLLFLRRPWGRRESLRTLRRLDRTLNLKELALTSWEILGQREKKETELLVVEEAEKELARIDPKALFKKGYSWQAIAVAPLLLLWVVAVWLDGASYWRYRVQQPQPVSIAKRVKEYSRQLQERARGQGLAESLKAGQALDELAEKNLAGEIGEKKLSEDLAAMAGRIEEMARAPRAETGFASAVAPRREPADLKAEIESFRRSHPFAGAGRQGGRLAPEMIGRLAALPHLSEEIERRFQAVERLDERDLGRALDQIEKEADAELDRDTLLELRDFLEQMLQGTEAGQVARTLRQAGKDEAARLSGRERLREKGAQPGNQPGAREETAQALPSLQARAGTHLKGLLGEGKSRSLSLSTEPAGRKSRIAEEEVVTSYRRRAEEEVASEQIPEGLKETIKRYFLSLGMTEDRNKE